MKKIVLALCLCIGVCNSTQPNKKFDNEWDLYKINYQKDYNHTTEELKRRITWEVNFLYILEHNIAANNGTYSYWLGINHLTDLTIEEVVEQRTGINQPTNSNTGTPLQINNTDDIPESRDWRKSGYVTRVKDQGQCGSCWAFSATGALEGQNMAVNKVLTSLSEQDLVDCSNKNNGCNGGWPSSAFQDIKTADGIATESSYPYTAQHGHGGACQFPQKNKGASVSGYNFTISGDEVNLKLVVATVGPVSVAIKVTPNFQSYQRGVLNDTTCTGSVNHAVLIVGYGVSGGQDYWLVKNSWGSGWGMNGYVLMSRNQDNQCSIASYGVYPTAEVFEVQSENRGQSLEMSFLQIFGVSVIVYLNNLHFYIWRFVW